MTLKQLLDLPFDEYMKVCREYATTLLEMYPDSLQYLEASWARRYWLYKNNEYEVD